MYFIFSLLLLTTIAFAENSNFECGSDNRWNSFNDEKCFRVIKTMATIDEAISACNEQNIKSKSYLPSLMTIKSKEEQTYLQNYLHKELRIVDNVWIGAKRDNNNRFVWNDGSDIEFSNWAQNRPSGDLNNRCAQMLPNDSLSSGQWIDTSCERQSLITCEKLQIWTFPDLQKAFLESRRRSDQKINHLNELLKVKDKQIGSLEVSVQQMSSRLTTFISETEVFKNEMLFAVNNSYQQLLLDNVDIREQLRIKGTQIVKIIQDIDYLKGNSSNGSPPNGSQIESLRTELLGVINTKINELKLQINNMVSDVKFDTINWRRALFILKNGQWSHIGYA